MKTTIIETIGKKIEESKTINLHREFYEFTAEELKELAVIFGLEDWGDCEINADDDQSQIQNEIFHVIFMMIWNALFPGDTDWAYTLEFSGESTIAEMANSAIAEAVPVSGYSESAQNELCSVSVDDMQSVLKSFESAFQSGYSCSDEGFIYS